MHLGWDSDKTVDVMTKAMEPKLRGSMNRKYAAEVSEKTKTITRQNDASSLLVAKSLSSPKTIR